MHAVDHADGTVVLATSAGLWRWGEAEGPTPLAPGADVVAIHRERDGVRAYPRPSRLADGTRLALDRAFDWTEGASTWLDRAIAPGDACLSLSIQGSWTAEARTDHSAVRVGHAAGASFWLACSGPRSAAWAGGSLIVTLLSGDVLLFPQLLDAIEPIVADIANTNVGAH